MPQERGPDSRRYQHRGYAGSIDRSGIRQPGSSGGSHYPCSAVAGAAQGGQSSSAPAPAANSASQGAAAPVPCVTPAQAASQAQGQAADDPGNGTQPLETASQPPPPCRSMNSRRRRRRLSLDAGLLGYASAGYYWIPGLWVEAPYMGALWTPGTGLLASTLRILRRLLGSPHWLLRRHQLRLWLCRLRLPGRVLGGGHFNYNSSVNRVNASVVHNVYSRAVVATRTAAA